MARSKYPRRADGRYYTTIELPAGPDGKRGRKHVYSRTNAEVQQGREVSS